MLGVQLYDWQWDYFQHFQKGERLVANGRGGYYWAKQEPEWVDNSVAYAGEDGQHGVYGRPPGDMRHEFCDIYGCFGKRDDCKLK